MKKIAITLVTLICLATVSLLTMAQVYEPQGPPGTLLDSFLELIDTPNDYSGQAGKFVKVDAGATGLEFGPGVASTDIKRIDIGTQTITGVGDMITLASGGYGLTRVKVRGDTQAYTLATENPFNTTGLATGHEAIVEGSSYAYPVSIVGNNKTYTLKCVDSDCQNRTAVKVTYLGSNTWDYIEITPHESLGTASTCSRVGWGGANEVGLAINTEGLNIVNNTCNPSSTVNFNKPVRAGSFEEVGDGSTPGIKWIAGQTTSCTGGVDCDPGCLLLEEGNTGGVTRGIYIYTHTSGKLWMVRDGDGLDGVCPNNGDGEPIDTMKIESGTAPTMDSADDISHDTTGGQLLYGSAPRVLTNEQERCFTVQDIDGTVHDNVPIWSPADPVTVTGMYCRTQGGTSVEMTVSDGTNAMDTITCDADGQADDGNPCFGNPSYCQFTANERVEFDTGTETGTVSFANMCLRFTYDRQ